MHQIKLTPTDKKRYAELRDLIRDLSWDFAHPEMAKKYMPKEWRDISVRAVPDKTRVTLRLDADVAKFFRKLGTGYQAQINQVLRSFMLAKLTEVLGAEPDAYEPDAPADIHDALVMSHEVRLHDDMMDMRRLRLGFDPEEKFG